MAIPEKVWLSFTVLGKTDVVDTSIPSYNINTGIDSLVRTSLVDTGSFSLPNAMIMDIGLLTEVIEYIGSLRTKIELYNNRVNSLDSNTTLK